MLLDDRVAESFRKALTNPLSSKAPKRFYEKDGELLATRFHRDGCRFKRANTRGERPRRDCEHRFFEASAIRERYAGRRDSLASYRQREWAHRAYFGSWLRNAGSAGSSASTQLVKRGYAYVSSRDDARDTWTIKYLMSGTIKAIEHGHIEVIGRGSHGEVLLKTAVALRTTAKTMWHRGRHTAGGAGGTQLLAALLGERDVFPFPKSVYAVRDAIAVAVGSRTDALIMDFFGGSGTTLNATSAQRGRCRKTPMHARHKQRSRRQDDGIST